MEYGFKVGDTVVIDNLLGNYNGIIGHMGVISKISNDYYYLTPTCSGGCWKKQHLRLVKRKEIIFNIWF